MPATPAPPPIPSPTTTSPIVMTTSSSASPVANRAAASAAASSPLRDHHHHRAQGRRPSTGESPDLKAHNHHAHHNHANNHHPRNHGGDNDASPGRDHAELAAALGASTPTRDSISSPVSSSAPSPRTPRALRGTHAPAAVGGVLPPSSVVATQGVVRGSSRSSDRVSSGSSTGGSSSGSSSSGSDSEAEDGCSSSSNPPGGQGSTGHSMAITSSAPVKPAINHASPSSNNAFFQSELPGSQQTSSRLPSTHALPSPGGLALSRSAGCRAAPLRNRLHSGSGASSDSPREAFDRSGQLESVVSAPPSTTPPVENRLPSCVNPTAGSGREHHRSNSSSSQPETGVLYGICIKNLPVRSSDSSLKDGLFHEYKKHGKVLGVKVLGQGQDRYAVVTFKKPEDAEKALDVSQDKQFFGCRIIVTLHEGMEIDESERSRLEPEMDEYHPKATRTLFVGNLEKDVSTSELRKLFSPFGEIIDVDIKKQGVVSAYSFIQYADIRSVVAALDKMDGQHIGANRIKLGFGKSMLTNCVWLDGIAPTVTEKYLGKQFGRFGPVNYAIIDRSRALALVYFDTVDYAQHAVAEMRGRVVAGKKLQVDFASRDCQNAFLDKMEASGQLRVGDRPEERLRGGVTGSSTGTPVVERRRYADGYEPESSMCSSSSRIVEARDTPSSRDREREVLFSPRDDRDGYERFSERRGAATLSSTSSSSYSRMRASVSRQTYTSAGGAGGGSSARDRAAAGGRGGGGGGSSGSGGEGGRTPYREGGRGERGGDPPTSSSSAGGRRERRAPYDYYAEDYAVERRSRNYEDYPSASHREVDGYDDRQFYSSRDRLLRDDRTGSPSRPDRRDERPGFSPGGSGAAAAAMYDPRGSASPSRARAPRSLSPITPPHAGDDRRRHDRSSRAGSRVRDARDVLLRGATHHNDDLLHHPTTELRKTRSQESLGSASTHGSSVHGNSPPPAQHYSSHLNNNNNVLPPRSVSPSPSSRSSAKRDVRLVRTGTGHASSSDDASSEKNARAPKKHHRAAPFSGGVVSGLSPAGSHDSRERGRRGGADAVSLRTASSTKGLPPDLNASTLPHSASKHGASKTTHVDGESRLRSRSPPPPPHQQQQYSSTKGASSTQLLSQSFLRRTDGASSSSAPPAPVEAEMTPPPAPPADPAAHHLHHHHHRIRAGASSPAASDGLAGSTATTTKLANSSQSTSATATPPPPPPPPPAVSQTATDSYYCDTSCDPNRFYHHSSSSHVKSQAAPPAAPLSSGAPSKHQPSHHHSQKDTAAPSSSGRAPPPPPTAPPQASVKVQPLSAAALEFQNLQREKQHLQQLLDEVTEASSSSRHGGGGGGHRREGLTKDLLEKDNKIPEKKILQDKMEKFFKEMNRSEAVDPALPPPPPPTETSKTPAPIMGAPSSHRHASASLATMISPGAPASSSSSASSRTGLHKKTHSGEHHLPHHHLPHHHPDLTYIPDLPPPSAAIPDYPHLGAPGLLQDDDDDHNADENGLHKRAHADPPPLGQLSRLSQLGNSTIPTAKHSHLNHHYQEHHHTSIHRTTRPAPLTIPPPPPDVSDISGDSPPPSPPSADDESNFRVAGAEDALKETLAERILQGKSSIFKEAPPLPPNEEEAAQPTATCSARPASSALSATELSLEERIRNLDQMLERVPPRPSESVVDYTKFRIRKRLESTPLPSSGGIGVGGGPALSSPSSAVGLPPSSAPPTIPTVDPSAPAEASATPTGPSEIVSRLLGSSRRSIFDEDSRRLEQIHEKYEPKELTKLDLSTTRTPVVRNPFRAKMVSLSSLSAGNNNNNAAINNAVSSQHSVGVLAVASSTESSTSSSLPHAPPFGLSATMLSDPRQQQQQQPYHHYHPHPPSPGLLSPSGHSSSSSCHQRESLDQRLRDQGLLNSPPLVSPSPDPGPPLPSSSQLQSPTSPWKSPPPITLGPPPSIRPIASAAATGAPHALALGPDPRLTSRHKLDNHASHNSDPSSRPQAKPKSAPLSVDPPKPTPSLLSPSSTSNPSLPSTTATTTSPLSANQRKDSFAPLLSPPLPGPSVGHVPPLHGILKRSSTSGSESEPASRDGEAPQAPPTPTTPSAPSNLAGVGAKSFGGGSVSRTTELTTLPSSGVKRKLSLPDGAAAPDVVASSAKHSEVDADSKRAKLADAQQQRKDKKRKGPKRTEKRTDELEIFGIDREEVEKKKEEERRKREEEKERIIKEKIAKSAPAAEEVKEEKGAESTEKEKREDKKEERKKEEKQRERREEKEKDRHDGERKEDKRDHHHHHHHHHHKSERDKSRDNNGKKGLNSKNERKAKEEKEGKRERDEGQKRERHESQTKREKEETNKREDGQGRKDREESSKKDDAHFKTEKEDSSKKEREETTKREDAPNKTEKDESKKEEHSKKERDDAKREDSHSKKERNEHKKEDGHSKKEEGSNKREKDDLKKDETHSKKEKDEPKKDESHGKKERNDLKKDDNHGKKERDESTRDGHSRKEKEESTKREDSHAKKDKDDSSKREDRHGRKEKEDGLCKREKEESVKKERDESTKHDDCHVRREEAMKKEKEEGTHGKREREEGSSKKEKDHHHHHHHHKDPQHFADGSRDKRRDHDERTDVKLEIKKEPKTEGSVGGVEDRGVDVKIEVGKDSKEEYNDAGSEVKSAAKDAVKREHASASSSSKKDAKREKSEKKEEGKQAKGKGDDKDKDKNRDRDKQRNRERDRDRDNKDRDKNKDHRDRDRDKDKGRDRNQDRDENKDEDNKKRSEKDKDKAKKKAKKNAESSDTEDETQDNKKKDSRDKKDRAKEKEDRAKDDKKKKAKKKATTKRDNSDSSSSSSSESDAKTKRSKITDKEKKDLMGVVQKEVSSNPFEVLGYTSMYDRVKARTVVLEKREREMEQLRSRLACYQKQRTKKTPSCGGKAGATRRDSSAESRSDDSDDDSPSVARTPTGKKSAACGVAVAPAATVANASPVVSQKSKPVPAKTDKAQKVKRSRVYVKTSSSSDDDEEEEDERTKNGANKTRVDTVFTSDSDSSESEEEKKPPRPKESSTAKSKANGGGLKALHKIYESSDEETEHEIRVSKPKKLAQKKKKKTTTTTTPEKCKTKPDSDSDVESIKSVRKPKKVKKSETKSTSTPGHSVGKSGGKTTTSPSVVKKPASTMVPAMVPAKTYPSATYVYSSDDCSTETELGDGVSPPASQQAHIQMQNDAGSAKVDDKTSYSSSKQKNVASSSSTSTTSITTTTTTSGSSMSVVPNAVSESSNCAKPLAVSQKSEAALDKESIVNATKQKPLPKKAKKSKIKPEPKVSSIEDVKKEVKENETPKSLGQGNLSPAIVPRSLDLQKEVGKTKDDFPLFSSFDSDRKLEKKKKLKTEMSKSSLTSPKSENKKGIPFQKPQVKAVSSGESAVLSPYQPQPPEETKWMLANYSPKQFLSSHLEKDAFSEDRAKPSKDRVEPLEPLIPFQKKKCKSKKDLDISSFSPLSSPTSKPSSHKFQRDSSGDGRSEKSQERPKLKGSPEKQRSRTNSGHVIIAPDLSNQEQEHSAAEKAVREKEEEMKKKSLEAALAVAAIAKQADNVPSPTTTIPVVETFENNQTVECNSTVSMEDDQRNSEQLQAVESLEKLLGHDDRGYNQINYDVFDDIYTPPATLPLEEDEETQQATAALMDESSIYDLPNENMDTGINDDLAVEHSDSADLTVGPDNYEQIEKETSEDSETEISSSVVALDESETTVLKEAVPSNISQDCMESFVSSEHEQLPFQVTQPETIPFAPESSPEKVSKSSLELGVERDPLVFSPPHELPAVISVSDREVLKSPIAVKEIPPAHDELNEIKITNVPKTEISQEPTNAEYDPISTPNEKDKTSDIPNEVEEAIKVMEENINRENSSSKKSGVNEGFAIPPLPICSNQYQDRNRTSVTNSFDTFLPPAPLRNSGHSQPLSFTSQKFDPSVLQTPRPVMQTPFHQPDYSAPLPDLDSDDSDDESPFHKKLTIDESANFEENNDIDKKNELPTFSLETEEKNKASEVSYNVTKVPLPIKCNMLPVKTSPIKVSPPAKMNSPAKFLSPVISPKKTWKSPETRFDDTKTEELPLDSMPWWKEWTETPVVPNAKSPVQVNPKESPVESCGDVSKEQVSTDWNTRAEKIGLLENSIIPAEDILGNLFEDASKNKTPNEPSVEKDVFKAIAQKELTDDKPLVSQKPNMWKTSFVEIQPPQISSPSPPDDLFKDTKPKVEEADTTTSAVSSSMVSSSEHLSSFPDELVTLNSNFVSSSNVTSKNVQDQVFDHIDKASSESLHSLRHPDSADALQCKQETLQMREQGSGSGLKLPKLGIFSATSTTTRHYEESLEEKEKKKELEKKIASIYDFDDEDSPEPTTDLPSLPKTRKRDKSPKDRKSQDNILKGGIVRKKNISSENAKNCHEEFSHNYSDKIFLGTQNQTKESVQYGIDELPDDKNIDQVIPVKPDTLSTNEVTVSSSDQWPIIRIKEPTKPEEKEKETPVDNKVEPVIIIKEVTPRIPETLGFDVKPIEQPIKLRIKDLPPKPVESLESKPFPVIKVKEPRPASPVEYPDIKKEQIVPPVKISLAGGIVKTNYDYMQDVSLPRPQRSTKGKRYESWKDQGKIQTTNAMPFAGTPLDEQEMKMRPADQYQVNTCPKDLKIRLERVPNSQKEDSKSRPCTPLLPEDGTSSFDVTPQVSTPVTISTPTVNTLLNPNHTPTAPIATKPMIVGGLQQYANMPARKTPDRELRSRASSEDKASPARSTRNKPLAVEEQSSTGGRRSLRSQQVVNDLNGKGRGRGKARKPVTRRGAQAPTSTAKTKSAAFTGSDYAVYEVDGDSQEEKFEETPASNELQDDQINELSIVGPPIKASTFGTGLQETTDSKSRKGANRNRPGRAVKNQDYEHIDSNQDDKVEDIPEQFSDSVPKAEADHVDKTESVSKNEEPSPRPSVIQENKSTSVTTATEEPTETMAADNASTAECTGSAEIPEAPATATTVVAPTPPPPAPTRGHKRKKGRKGAKAKPKKPAPPPKKEYDKAAIQEELDKISLLKTETVPVTTTTSLSSPFKNLTRDRAPKRALPSVDSSEMSVPPKKRAWDRLSKAKEAAAAAQREEEQAKQTVAPKPRHKQYASEIAAKLEQQEREEKERREKEEEERAKREEMMRQTAANNSGPSDAVVAPSVRLIEAGSAIPSSSATASPATQFKPFPAHMKADLLTSFPPRGTPSPRGLPIAVSPGLPTSLAQVPPMAHASSVASVMGHHPPITASAAASGRQPGPYVPQVPTDKHSLGPDATSGGRLVGGNPTPPMTPPISAGQQLPAASTAHHADLRSMMGQHHPLAKAGTSGRSTPLTSGPPASPAMIRSLATVPKSAPEIPHPVAPVPPASSSAILRGSGGGGVSASPSPAALPPLPASSTPGLTTGGKLPAVATAAALAALSAVPDKRPPSASTASSTSASVATTAAAMQAFATAAAITAELYGPAAAAAAAGFGLSRGAPFPPGAPPPPPQAFTPPLSASGAALAAAVHQTGLHPALLHAEGRTLPPPPPDYARPPSRPSSSTPIAALSPHIATEITHLKGLAATGGGPGSGGTAELTGPSSDPAALGTLFLQYPVSWHGVLALKNDLAHVKMHFVSGNQDLARLALPSADAGAPITPGGAPLSNPPSQPTLRVNQRMRLETQQLEGVIRRMQMPKEHCLLMAIPHGCSREEITKRTEDLNTGFIQYLTQKQAAGIVNVNHPGTTAPGFVVHIFPPCEFTHRKLEQIAPELSRSFVLERFSHLMVVITTCA